MSLLKLIFPEVGSTKLKKRLNKKQLKSGKGAGLKSKG
jgi:hypothetical protein